MTDLAGKFLPAGIRQTIRPGEKSAARVQLLLFSSTKMQLRQLNSGWRVPLRLVPEVPDAGKEHRQPEPVCRGDHFAVPDRAARLDQGFGPGARGFFDAVRDRKSTRLNSSHLVISYAVFCLKKKKNTQVRSLKSDIIKSSHLVHPDAGS